MHKFINEIFHYKRNMFITVLSVKNFNLIYKQRIH